MAYSFEDARRIADAALRPDWRPDDGTLIVLPNGFEDDTHWHVIAGASEYLIDGDPAYEVLDAPALLVSKETGQLERVPVIASFDRLDRMTTVGNAP